MQLHAEPTRLAEQVDSLRATRAAPSSALLHQALLCLQCGHPELAARLLSSGRLSAEHQAELRAAETIDLLSLYSSWKAACTSSDQAGLSASAVPIAPAANGPEAGPTANGPEAGPTATDAQPAPSANGWQAALSPANLLRLGLLLSRCEGEAMTRLRSDLQELFGEAMVQADLPQALQLWDQLCRRCPNWSWARLMACDLALQQQQLELCHHHLETAPSAERRSISLLDVEARLRLQQQFVQEALRCWDAAIEQANAERQFKWAIALVRRRHAARMAYLRSTPSQGVPARAELDRISSLLHSMADRYGIKLPPPSSPSDPP